MIPLAHWLEDKAEGGRPNVSADLAASGCSAEQLAADEEMDGTLAASSQHAERLQQLEHALREAEDRLASLTHEHARKEKAITDELGAALSNRLALDIGIAFRSLSQHVEGAVTEALMPFLEVSVRERAVASLAELIRQEIKNREAPVLEIRSPVSLHERLEEALRGTDMAIKISESATIDIVFTGERLRFQDLASAWSAAITGDEA